MDELQQSIVNLQNQIDDIKNVAGSSYKNNFSNTVLQGKTVIQTSGEMISPNFVTGTSGWSIASDGSVEFNDGVFRGTVAAGAINIGGDDATSAHIDTDGNFWLGASVANKATAPARITNGGVAHFSSISLDTDVVLTGLQAGSALAIQYLTAGSITSKAITLAVAAGTGDSYIASGKTDFTNTDAGFILGLDDSDSDRAKFYIGNSTDYLNWTGLALSVKGTITATAGTIGSTTISSTALTGGIIQTDTSGDRLVMTEDSFASNNNPAIDCYEDNVCVGSYRPQIGTVGKGVRMESYIWSTGDEATLIGTGYADDLGISGGNYHWVDIKLDQATGITIERDQDFSDINHISGLCRISASLNPPTGTGTDNGDIGRSDSIWDNMWVEDINYQTLSDFSDERLKKNIKNIDVGLNELLQLRPVNFEWKKDGKKDSGFIAQEVKNIVPSVVKEGKQKEVTWEHPDKKGKNKGKKIKTWHKILPEGAKETDDGLLMMEPMRLIPILVKSIQELNAKVVALESKIV